MYNHKKASQIQDKRLFSQGDMINSVNQRYIESYWYEGRIKVKSTLKRCAYELTLFHNNEKWILYYK